MTVHLHHDHMSFMTSDFPVCLTLCCFVCLQTSGPEGSLKDGARTSLQKSFRVLNEAKMLESNVNGMCSILHSDPLNRGGKCCEWHCYASGMRKPYRRKVEIVTWFEIGQCINEEDCPVLCPGILQEFLSPLSISWTRRLRRTEPRSSLANTIWARVSARKIARSKYSWLSFKLVTETMHESSPSFWFR